jgi:hypothetical protein
MVQPEYTETDGIAYDEVTRRVPTLRLIDDDFIQNSVIMLTMNAPAYFWKRPGSYNEYHNASEHGLWHHTLKLSTAIEVLKDSYLEANQIREADVDKLHAAAILHDQWKNGEDPNSMNTASNHPAVMGKIIRDYSELDIVIARMVEEHMGPWGDDEPTSPGSQLLHEADVWASTDRTPLPVYGPVPSELDDIVHSIIEVSE